MSEEDRRLGAEDRRQSGKKTITISIPLFIIIVVLVVIIFVTAMAFMAVSYEKKLEEARNANNTGEGLVEELQYPNGSNPEEIYVDPDALNPDTYDTNGTYTVTTPSDDENSAEDNAPEGSTPAEESNSDAE